MFTITCLSGIASASTTISIIPTSQSVEEGQNFAVSFYLDPDRPVAGIQFDLSYDSELVKVVQVSEGEFLRQDGALVWFNPGQIESSNGRIDSVYGLILDKTSVTEPEDFVVIHMKAGNVSGISSLELSNVVVSDTQGQIIPIDVVNGSVTIVSDTASSTKSKTSDKDDYGAGGISTTSGSYEEFEIIEKSSRSVYLGSQVSYQFDKPENPIMYINYESLTNAGNVVATIEVLKQTSLLVSSPPPGIVYKDVNIWLGKPGYSTESNMKDAVIGFRVDRSWLEENQISDSSVMMYRYDQDLWVPLSTKKINESSSDVSFEAETSGFSPFAIVGESSDDITGKTEVDDTPAEDESLDQNAAFILCLSMLLLLFARRH
ncbi:PGF-pre-PGF domain-containing protein [Methanococcoides vulcani]|uniref:PGF-pre-PGF domain-containing protein n=1 Tax=Methanococcoides vulcani TaxID=1353158 RepID=UPI0014383FE2|nr:PGF-pre-PGF domain-containing protein [Methanococcoides vulcani]